MDDTIELREVFEQINYCLSLQFKEKYRHKYGSHFINLFQEKITTSLQTRKPLTKKILYEFFTKKHAYNLTMIQEFFEEIDISLLYPVIL
jgi:hypothetical protein